MLELTAERRRSLARLVHASITQRTGDVDEGAAVGRWPGTGAPAAAALGSGQVTVGEVEVLRPGRPGILDVLAEVDGATAHAILGVCQPGDEQRFLRPREDGVLGLLEDGHGTGVVVDALGDARLAPLVLAAVTGSPAREEAVAPLRDDAEAVAVAFDNRCQLTVFPWVLERPHPGVELLVALDEAGFNHLAAPLALWRRGGRDLGVVQELMIGAADGWALALTSLRDLYASGGLPEEAGGDFAPEASALGTMTARMHLALDRAFGRRSVDLATLADAIEREARARHPALLEDAAVAEALESARAVATGVPALRTHGDFHLGRTARTDHGWIVADTMPGGRPWGAALPEFRSPLADVADLLWSLHHVAAVAAEERDPSGQGGLAALAQAWEGRNRRAFLRGYLRAPGIHALVPEDHDVVVHLVAAFEIERAVARLTPSA